MRFIYFVNKCAAYYGNIMKMEQEKHQCSEVKVVGCRLIAEDFIILCFQYRRSLRVRSFWPVLTHVLYIIMQWLVVQRLTVGSGTYENEPEGEIEMSNLWFLLKTCTILWKYIFINTNIQSNFATSLLYLFSLCSFIYSFSVASTFVTPMHYEVSAIPGSRVTL